MPRAEIGAWRPFGGGAVQDLPSPLSILVKQEGSARPLGERPSNGHLSNFAVDFSLLSYGRGVKAGCERCRGADVSRGRVGVGDVRRNLQATWAPAESAVSRGSSRVTGPCVL